MALFNKFFGGLKKSANIEPPKNINFTPTEQLMEEDQFWSIINISKQDARGNFDRQQEKLAVELIKLTPDDIILFGNRFRYFRGQANSWELWGAIYIIHGGCGDDSFNDFREWVIGQGKDFYYRTINDPETLVEIEPKQINEINWEGLGYVPASSFQTLTGQKMPYSFKEQFETTGIEWAEDNDDLKNMFPKLYAKYPYDV